MKLLNMKGTSLCLLYSAAMVLDDDVDEMIQRIGWTGLERMWDKPEPMCYRSHHIQEIQEYAIVWHHKCFYPIEHEPMIASDDGVQPKLAIHHGDEPTARLMGLILEIGRAHV